MTCRAVTRGYWIRSKDIFKGDVQRQIKELYRQKSNLAISSSPVTNNNVQFIKWAYYYRVKKLKISSSVQGLSMMTLREYLVDRPFPVT
jgi:hypothetical protein